MASPGRGGGWGGHIVVLSSLCWSAGETWEREADEQEKLGRRPPPAPKPQSCPQLCGGDGSRGNSVVFCCFSQHCQLGAAGKTISELPLPPRQQRQHPLWGEEGNGFCQQSLHLGVCGMARLTSSLCQGPLALDREGPGKLEGGGAFPQRPSAPDSLLPGDPHRCKHTQ